MAKIGRPLKEINWEEFEKLCHIQCTQAEIASWFNCSVDCLEQRVKKQYGQSLSVVYKEKAEGGKISLRRLQWQMAQKSDRVMLIWLGKQYLNQKEKQETQIAFPKPTVIKRINGEEVKIGIMENESRHDSEE